MAWIESHQEVAHHPKTRKLARRLDLSIPTAVGHLHCLWHWALSFAEDGNLSRHDAEDVAVGAMWDGDPESFHKALVSAGYVDDTEEGFFLHDWDEYTGKLIALREARAEAGRAGAKARWDKGNGKPKAKPKAEPETPLAQNGTNQPTNQTEPDQPDQTEPTEPQIRFEDFWNAYPDRNGTKGSKKNARAGWNKLTPQQRKAALEGIEPYVRSVSKGFTKDPERYIRGELWDGLVATGSAGDRYSTDPSLR